MMTDQFAALARPVGPGGPRPVQGRMTVMSSVLLRTTVSLVAALAVFAADSRRCGAGAIYFSEKSSNTGGKIDRAAIDGTGQTTLVQGLSSPIGIAVDGNNKKIYYGVIGGISVANLDGTGADSFLNGLGEPGYLALDLTHNTIYWTDLKTNQIDKSSLNNPKMTTVLQFNAKNSPYDLALDVQANKMYWTVPTLGEIDVANLNGKGVTPLVKGLKTPPLGIALDTKNQLLYFTQANANDIGVGQLDVLNLKTMKTDVLIKDLPDPTGLAVDLDDGNGYLFWTDPTKNAIYQSSLTGQDVKELITGLKLPLDIAIGPAATTPEPSSLVLMSIALAAGIVLDRRRRRRRKGESSPHPGAREHSSYAP
jgi:DNA-binding beta-propeller fold protein YncE